MDRLKFSQSSNLAHSSIEPSYQRLKFEHYVKKVVCTSNPILQHAMSPLSRSR